MRSGDKEVGLLELLRHTLKHVPRGKVSTYGAIARAAGYPGCARQVVWALQKANGLPWHRVVGAGGRILLPGERALEQRTRLEVEGVQFRGGRVDMNQHEYRFKERAPALRVSAAPTPRR